MTDQENNEKKQNSGPDFVAYNVHDNGKGKDYWDRIGIASMHRDGKGVDIRLHSIPTDGHVTLRERAQNFKNQREEKTQEHSVEQSHSPKIG